MLRVKGTEISPQRQSGQVGAELIGVASPLADVEAIAVAAGALMSLGVARLSVDLPLPTLVPALVEAYAIGAETAAD